MVFAALGWAKVREAVGVVEEIAFGAAGKLGHFLALPRPHMRSYRRKFYHSNMNSIHFW
jgi:hypothetical protein